MTSQPVARWRHTWGLRVFADPRFVRYALVLVLIVVLGYRALQLIAWSSAPQWGYDFSFYWAAADRLGRGDALYLPFQLAGPYSPQGRLMYLYPPWLAVFLEPLAAIPLSVAKWCWFALGLFVLLGTVALIVRTEALAGGRRQALLLLAAVLAFPPVVAELVLGNVHLELLGLLAVAWWGIRTAGQDRRRGWIAGGAIAIATLIKVFPALLALWLLASRRFGAFAAFALVGSLAALATVPVTGMQPWLDYPTVLMNMTLPVDTTDALAPSVWVAMLLPSFTSRALVAVLAVGVVIWSATRMGPREGYAVAVAASVLAAPALFQHYLAVLVLPMLLAIPLALTRKTSRAALLASYFAMWPGEQPLLGGAAWVLNRAVPTFGALGVPATLAAWGRRRTPQDKRAPPD